MCNGDNNCNTYNCVIKALDFGARFLMQSQALPLSSCVALGKLLFLCALVSSSINWGYYYLFHRAVKMTA